MFLEHGRWQPFTDVVLDYLDNRLNLTTAGSPTAAVLVPDSAAGLHPGSLTSGWTLPATDTWREAARALASAVA